MLLHKATEADGLGAKILKVAAPAISLPLSQLTNPCIDSSTLLSAWKSAEVTIIYKFQKHESTF